MEIRNKEIVLPILVADGENGNIFMTSVTDLISLIQAETNITEESQ